jgi:hypothetical protein
VLLPTTLRGPLRQRLPAAGRLLSDRARAPLSQRGDPSAGSGPTGNRPDLFGAPPPPADLAAALVALPDRRRLLDHNEQRLIEARLDAGGTWAGVADALGLTSADAARQRYRRLGGTRTWPAGRRAGPGAGRPTRRARS